MPITRPKARPRTNARRGSFVIGLVATTACGSGAPPALPAPSPPDLQPRDAAQAAAWSEGFAPATAIRVNLRWTYIRNGQSTSGRAAVAFVPPDSIRLDYRAPFGRRGSAVLIGDEVRWAQPPEQANRLIQVATLFWAALGWPRPPSAGDAVTGRSGEGEVLWQYRRPDTTITYRHTMRSRSLLTQLTSNMRAVGTASAATGGDGRVATEGRLQIVDTGVSVVFRVLSVDTIPAGTEIEWRPPERERHSRQGVAADSSLRARTRATGHHHI